MWLAGLFLLALFLIFKISVLLLGPLFGLLVTSALGFKAREDPSLAFLTGGESEGSIAWIYQAVFPRSCYIFKQLECSSVPLFLESHLIISVHNNTVIHLK